MYVIFYCLLNEWLYTVYITCATLLFQPHYCGQNGPPRYPSSDGHMVVVDEGRKGDTLSMIPDKMANQHIGISLHNKLATKVWFKLYDLQPDFSVTDEYFTL